MRAHCPKCGRFACFLTEGVIVEKRGRLWWKGVRRVNTRVFRCMVCNYTFEKIAKP